MSSITASCVRAARAEVLTHDLGGKDISEVLAMSVSEAIEFFGSLGVGRTIPRLTRGRGRPRSDHRRTESLGDEPPPDEHLP